MGWLQRGGRSEEGGASREGEERVGRGRREERVGRGQEWDGHKGGDGNNSTKINFQA